MAVQTRQDLIDYCLHQLGYPVIQVELDEQQIEYCIDNAVELFQNVHMDGSTRVFLPYTITQQDIDREYLVLPEGILSVVRVLRMQSATTSSLQGMGLFNPVYQYQLSDMWDISRGGMAYFNDMMTNLQMISNMFQGDIGLQFSKYANKLKLEVDWKNANLQFQVGTIIVIECFVVQDPAEVPKLYGDRWLKRYATALLKLQWSNNIKKYNGAQLPGGITLNGQQIYNEAVQEVEALEQELHTMWEEPPIFFMG